MFQLRIPKMVQFVFKIGPVLRTGREGGRNFVLVQFVFKIGGGRGRRSPAIGHLIKPMSHLHACLLPPSPLIRL